MKLRIIDEKGKEKIINVKFWSFFKCNLLVELALAGIIYGVIIFMWIWFFLIMGLAGSH